MQQKESTQMQIRTTRPVQPFLMALGLALATALSLVHATPASARARTCNGVNATIIAGSAGQINGTAGDDVILGTSGADQIFGLGGNDTICGGAGDDQITGGQGSDLVLGGDGNDTLNWNPGDGSDVLEGQAGRDSLRVFGANVGETIELSANGSRLRFTRDIALVVLDSAGIEQVSYVALGGTDTVRVQSLAGTAVTGVSLDLAASTGGGDGLADSVTVFGTAGADSVTVSGSSGGALVSGLGASIQVSGAEPSLDTLRVNGLEGNDTLSAQPLSAGVLWVVLDGGAGADILMGSAGDDMLFGGADADQLTGWLGSDYFSGGDGTDTFTDFNSGEGDMSDGS
jgi:Ca2+-binding RTX toxin-like protein